MEANGDQGVLVKVTGALKGVVRLSSYDCPLLELRQAVASLLGASVARRGSRTACAVAESCAARMRSRALHAWRHAHAARGTGGACATWIDACDRTIARTRAARHTRPRTPPPRPRDAPQALTPRQQAMQQPATRQHQQGQP
jgi:hypothetical protein